MACHYDIPTAAELRDGLRQRIAALERSHAELLDVCRETTEACDYLYAFLADNNEGSIEFRQRWRNSERRARAAIANAEKVVTT